MVVTQLVVTVRPVGGLWWRITVEGLNPIEVVKEVAKQA